MADNKRRGRFGRGSDDDVPQSIFDLFEPPPDQDAATFTRIPIIRDDAELDLTDAGMVEAQMAAEAEAAGLAHWTEPPTGQVPKALASAVTQDDKWADMRGPSWQGEEPNWAGPDLSDVFADTEAISHRRVVESDDDLTIEPSSAPPPPGRQARPERPERPERAAYDPAPQPRVAPPPAPNGPNGRPGAPIGTPPAPSVFGDRPAVAGRPTAPPPGAAAFDDRPNRPAPTAGGPPPAAGRGQSAFDERQPGRGVSAFDERRPDRGVSAFDERQAARGPAAFDERQAAPRNPSPFGERQAPQVPSAFDERQAARSGAAPADPDAPQSVFDDRRRLGSPPPPPAASRPSPPPAPAPAPAPRPQSQPAAAAPPPSARPAAGQPGPPRALPPDATQPGPVGGRLLAPDPTPAGSPPPPAGRDSGPGRAAASPQVPAQRGRLPGVRLEGPDAAAPGGPPPGAVRRGAHDAPPLSGDPTLRPGRVPVPERGPAPNRAAPPPQPQTQPPGGPAAPAERMGRFEQHPLDDPRAAARFEPGPQRRQEAAPGGYDPDEEYDAPGAATPPAKSIGPRVVVGVALAALVGVALGLGPTITMLLVGVLTLLAVMELFNTMRIAGLRPATLLGLVGAVALPAAAYVRGETGYPLVIGLAVIFGMLWYLTGADTERPVLNLGLTFLGVLWVGGLAGFAALMLRAEESVQLLAATIAITAISDTFAYFGGRAYGTKPFHSASPNKTWEGTFTGFFGALVVGLVIGMSGLLDLFDGHFTAVMALAALVGVLAPIGDLAESLVKRDLGVKDMGSLLPGHGGILDRIDGLLFALPGAYYLGVIFGLF